MEKGAGSHWRLLAWRRWKWASYKQDIIHDWFWGVYLTFFCWSWVGSRDVSEKLAFTDQVLTVLDQCRDCGSEFYHCRWSGRCLFVRSISQINIFNAIEEIRFRSQLVSSWDVTVTWGYVSPWVLNLSSRLREECSASRKSIQWNSFSLWISMLRVLHSIPMRVWVFPLFCKAIFGH